MKRNNLKNIEYFDLYTAKILAKLYEVFPKRICLECEDITEKHDDLDSMTYRPENEICEDTVRWLKDSGYIIYTDESLGCFDGCVLSSKGLEILKQQPKSLKSQEGYGEKLLSISKKGTKQVISQTVNALLRQGVELAIKGQVL